jgi:hypothetical protein
MHSMSENVREQGCALPTDAMYDRTNTRYPQVMPKGMLLSCDCASRLRSACLAMTVRAIACLSGQAQTLGHRRGKAITNHFSKQFCWVAATMLSENLCLDCAHKNNPSFNVYCLSGRERTFHATRKHHTSGAQNWTRRLGIQMARARSRWQT